MQNKNNRRGGHVVALSWMLPLPLLLSGCGLHLYSAQRDQQGVAATAAWTAADPTATITTARDNLNKLLVKEMAVQDQMAAAIVDYEVKVMLGQPTLKAGLVDRVQEQLKTLVGPGFAAFDPSASEQDMDAYQEQLKPLALVFTNQKLAVPTCADVAGNKTPAAIKQWMTTPAADAGAQVKVTFAMQQLSALCDSVTGTTPDYAALGGVVQNAQFQYEADQAALKALSDSSAPLQAAYDAALKAYQAKAGEAHSNPKAVPEAERLKQLLEKARDALDKAPDAISAQFISAEKLKAFDHFIDTVNQSSDGALPADASTAAVAFALLPGLYDDTRTALADAKKPRALPLVLRRDIEQLRLEAATRDITLLKKRVSLSQEIRDTAYQQATQYWYANRLLSQDGSKPSSANIVKLYTRTPSDAFNNAGAAEKAVLYRAAAIYLYGVNQLSAKRYKAERARLATYDEIALNHSENSVKQWNTLISAQVSQVAGSAKDGIKAESLTSIISAASLLFIAHGVNK